jgi:hypothetical protein
MSHINGIPYVRKIYDNGDSKKKIEKTSKKVWVEGSTTIQGRRTARVEGLGIFLVLPYNQICVYGALLKKLDSQSEHVTCESLAPPKSHRQH